MEIDWITISAQIVNFAILVYLLRRFLYGPIVDAVDARSKQIQDRVRDIDARDADATERHRAWDETLASFEAERESLLADARQQADDQRKRWLEAARRELADTQTEWKRQVAAEKLEFRSRVQRHGADAVLNIARRALGDLADADLESQVIAAILRRIADGSDHAHDDFDPSKFTGAVRVASSFPLGADARATISHGLQQAFGRELDLEWRVEPALLCGIELTAAGQRASWSLADYIEDLGTAIDSAFQPLEHSGDQLAAAHAHAIA